MLTVNEIFFSIQGEARRGFGEAGAVDPMAYRP
jgi:hypothetical protein